MSTLEKARVNAEMQAWLAIQEACPNLLKEGGIVEVLRFLTFLTQGEVLPVQVACRLKRETARV